MKTIKFKNQLFLIIALNLNIFVLSQDSSGCSFISTFRTSQGAVFSTKEISNQEFDTIAKQNYKLSEEFEIQNFSNPKEAEEELIREFPKVFIKKNNGYDFPSTNGDTLSVRNIKATISADRNFKQYEFIGRLKNYVIIHWLGYEDWGHFIIDTKKNQAYSLPGKPKFISPNRIYSHTNYYGQTVIKLMNLDSEKDVTVLYENTDLLKIVELPYEELVFKLERADCKFSANMKFLLFQL